ncbi:MAG: hypothetical protein A3F17_05785 [Gammaproteobacteria bacterium RIFCSPHIGHO2_12_FULL_41_15]|nr:MAG: hypothetical protein A3F17_05785 [Gammaproteobacteria bacterium RIFCSPHIGHO2_12_FULL_41_15]
MTHKSPREISIGLAKRIRVLRLRKNWSRQQLADQAGVNVYSLKRFECTGNISLSRLLSICLVLGVLGDFDHILKPRERVNVDAWTVPQRAYRQRGGRRRVRSPAPLRSSIDGLVTIET